MEMEMEEEKRSRVLTLPPPRLPFRISSDMSIVRYKSKTGDSEKDDCGV